MFMCVCAFFFDITLSTAGVSVCLRYLIDYMQESTPVIFTLSPSSTPLRLMRRSGPHRGSVLTWSSISYSARADVIMEDVYELQAKQPIKSSSRGRGNQLKGKKKTRKFWNPMEKKARNRQLV
ncbi:hypothetical protein GBF38_013112 [Nibea albiflora]|uniref:Uncharacterized protein n=1 Tax=Nibea albiflora TaxID=240163 RepID=A0ACB7F030_NIBAL|nr:hypothetical protein GBF38_013112 [Nibea albiflora]